MPEYKKNSVADFLVTFFVENRITSCTLRDIIKNRDSPLFLEKLELQ